MQCIIINLFQSSANSRQKMEKSKHHSLFFQEFTIPNQTKFCDLDLDTTNTWHLSWLCIVFICFSQNPVAVDTKPDNIMQCFTA